ncbi:MAG: ABC transporter permease [Treponema sp.]|jgi:spermidine/putrescine transport system permease protein|nr:ABC transporter permease [Treponema sp.]
MKKRGFWQNGYLALILAVMYIPLILVIAFSFNESHLNSVWKGFTFKWYGELFRDRAMFDALWNSLVLAVSASLLAGILGTLGAVGKASPRNQGVGPGIRRMNDALEYLSILPIMLPEIILGMVFLAYFNLLRLPPGMLTLIISHTAFCVPYVYLVVQGRLAGMDKSYTEAAKNLGAGPQRVFFDITLPLILPAVISGMLLSFAMSFDDVIISVFVTGPRVNTLPIRIYSQLKTGITPKTNALCVLLFIVAVILCILSTYLSGIRTRDTGKTPRHKRRGEKTRGVE